MKEYQCASCGKKFMSEIEDPKPPKGYVFMKVAFCKECGNRHRKGSFPTLNDIDPRFTTIIKGNEDERRRND